MLTVNYNRILERQKKLDDAWKITASLVHEVKNSLQVINGYSTLLNEIPALPDEGKRMNSMIRNTGTHLDELIINYTELLKHKSFQYKMADLNKIIEGSIGISEDFLRKNSVDVVFDKNYRTLKTYINPPLLKQVFVNLIKNSSESFPIDRYYRKIIISTEIQGDRIYINIKDTGRGIFEENWESIFNPFTTSNKDGLGLGLPFVKYIIFEHRGDIKVINSSPNGTHIQIEIPQFSFSDLNIGRDSSD
ncbi:sensor histidine kinase [Sutcliffiella halmapala]|uniref:sensor histidine kinase n=1 Tax=Sutcliffiella halmapala TaxID=79882 RepID=UPI0014753F3C|nr:HAMP domain-containing sensor histidine kinase [Sutcliffiella halmapala]